MKAILIIFVALLACTYTLNEKRRVCYFNSMSTHRSGNAKFDISNIDPHLCTHLIYAFVGIESNGTIKILESTSSSSDVNYKRFNKLRSYNPKLKTMIAVGGWSEGSIKYSQMASNVKIRKAFVKNAVNFVKKYKFDGLDVDWEYPNKRGGVEVDKRNFVLLLRELRNEFDKAKLLLSVAVGSIESIAKSSYIVSEISKYVNFINLMTYGLHPTSDKKIGHNAPLYPDPADNNEEKQLTVSAAVTYWLKQGAEPDKLNLGMALFGHSFTLKDPKNMTIGASASAGIPGPYTLDAGTFNYREICEDQRKNHWNVGYDDVRQVPYAVKGDQWISYDSPRSLEQKVKLLKEYNLGGAMVWSIENDDFRGDCGSKYPLLNAIKSALNYNRS